MKAEFGKRLYLYGASRPGYPSLGDSVTSSGADKGIGWKTLDAGTYCIEATSYDPKVTGAYDLRSSVELTLINGTATTTTTAPTTTSTAIATTTIKPTTSSTIQTTTTTAACIPPKIVYADNSRAFGLFEATVKNVNVGSLTSLNIDIQATDIKNIPFIKPRGVQFWIAIEEISYEPNIITIQSNEDDGLGATCADLRLIAPSTHASFQANFCKPGSITIELGFNNTAIILTLADAIISIVPIIKEVNPSKVLSFTDSLNDIPLIVSGASHISNAINLSLDKKLGQAYFELNRAGSDLIRLSLDKRQREQLLEAFKNLGIDITLSKLFTALLTAPMRVFEIFGDCIVLAVQTNLGTSGMPIIKIIAD